MNSLLIFSIVFFFIFDTTNADYWKNRDAILTAEASQVIGSSIILTEKEQQVNDILMSLKLKEYDEGFADPAKFLPSIHFFRSKSAIEASEVFNFIKMMPKGASLHSHTAAMLSLDSLFNLTYYDNLYGCDIDATFRLKFFLDIPNSDCNWRLLSDWRKSDINFDQQLRTHLTLVVDNPELVYSNINKVWTKFESIFDVVRPLLQYRPALRQYLYEVFREFHDDNVMYMEIRGSFGETFDENGITYDAPSNAQFYLDTLREFQNNYRDFIGFLIIYSRVRKAASESMATNIEEFLQIQELFPGLIAGFDLIGQEDKGEPLSAYADQLLTIANKTKFFFHAGETNWYGTSTDQNLIDAVLLNTSRIGHGFALTKHPEVLKIVKEKNIPIELNPLSNQVLKLVDDLRNHIGTYLIANGYPVVITCDDPSFWGAKGVSYDWYMTFMGMTPRNGNLRILKQLALNSITYSAIDPVNLLYFKAIFEGRWDDFLNAVLKKYRTNVSCPRGAH